jgi:hypothetical protein
MKKAEPSQPASKPVEVPVSVQDAWDHSWDIARGLWNLLSISADSDEGITPEGCKALETAAWGLVQEMKTLNGFFNPENEKDFQE